MRFATYDADGNTYFAAVKDEDIIALDSDLPEWPTLCGVIEATGFGMLRNTKQDEFQEPIA